MRPLPTLAVLASLCVPPPVSAIAPRTSAPAADLIEAVKDSLVPQRIPGFELRALDARKPLLFEVGDQWVEVPLPILIFVPTADRERAITLLRELGSHIPDSDLSRERIAEKIRRIVDLLEN